MSKTNVRGIVDEAKVSSATVSAGKFRSLAQVKYAFDYNTVELLRALSAHGPAELELFSWAGDSRGSFELLQRELGRRLQNFVTSGADLIDAACTVRATLPAARLSGDGERRESEFAADPVSQFLAELRVYLLQCSDLPVFAQTEGIAGQSTRREVFLPVERLREFSGWSEPATQYFSQFNDAICLNDTVRAHFQKVRSFCRPIYERLVPVESVDFATLNETQQELHRAHYGEAVISLRVGLELVRLGCSTPDNVIGEALPVEVRRQIAKLSNPVARCEAAMEFLAERTEVPDDLAAALRSVCGTG